MEAMVEHVVKTLKSLPKPLLHAAIYQLMTEGVISYHELMDMHVQNLERMAKGETEAYFRLQKEVTSLFHCRKKDRSQNIRSIMQLLYDEGRINTTQEKIDKFT